MKAVRVDISWTTLWQILIFLGIILILSVAKEAIGVLFIGIVLSLGIDPIVGFLESKGVNRILGTLVVFITGLLILSTAVLLVVPVVVVEAGALLSQLNEVFSTFFGLGIPEAAIQGVSSSLNRILSFITASNISITGAISVIIRNLVFIVATIIVSFYLSIEKNGTERLLRVVLPTAYERCVLSVFGRFKTKIRRWLIAQLGLSVIVGVVVTLGLWLLGVKYAVTLGVIAAIFELVPVIGPILSGAVAFLTAISSSFMLGVYVVIFFFIVQQLENNVLIPIIMKRTMRIHPIVVLIALIAGAQAAGFFGIVVAVPVALLLQETFNYIAEQKDSKGSLGI